MAGPSIEALSKKFGIDRILRFDPGVGGLIRASIRTDSAAGEMYLYGGHVTHYQPLGQEPVLFMSKESWFEEGKPIRGGVPICFPWFGPRADDSAAPSHGLARIRSWDLIHVQPHRDGLTLELCTEIEPFRLTHEATFGPALTMKLTVQNTSPVEASFEEALHTYFSVSDVRRISISGLGGTRYLSKVKGGQFVQSDDRIRFSNEMDRIYLGTQAACVIEDPGLRRRISVEKSHSDTTVVWNPWINKSASMPDFGDDEWPGMVCIETCNVCDHAVKLAPGKSHKMTARIRVAESS